MPALLGIARILPCVESSALFKLPQDYPQLNSEICSTHFRIVVLMAGVSSP